MQQPWQDIVIASTQAQGIGRRETLQSLWSGYGVIERVSLIGAPMASVIVKRVMPPDASVHSRGWNTARSHARKLRSYAVERHWYAGYAIQCDVSCRVPQVFAQAHDAERMLLVLEDLDAAGFSQRAASLSVSEIRPCLSWLASFHAKFMGCKPEGLWPTGTYWHLQTRPDELHAMTDLRLQRAAGPIDEALAQCEFQTFVHGDAKIANFCLSPDGTAVAAVDFQYVGGGCGMKDVAYLLGSCLSEHDCAAYESALLDDYFAQLRFYLNQGQSPFEVADIEQSWRELFHYAWVDFYRFLQGWMPHHKKINAYSRSLAEHVLQDLGVD
ncbi:MAG TPA: choline kinase [Gammaproteobacteria bacterium]|nr:choline kinase [Gammaproteobacteria bacterium]